MEPEFFPNGQPRISGAEYMLRQWRDAGGNIVLESWTMVSPPPGAVPHTDESRWTWQEEEELLAYIAKAR